MELAHEQGLLLLQTLLLAHVREHAQCTSRPAPTRHAGRWWRPRREWPHRPYAESRSPKSARVRLQDCGRPARGGSAHPRGKVNSSAERPIISSGVQPSMAAMRAFTELPSEHPHRSARSPRWRSRQWCGPAPRWHAVPSPDELAVMDVGACPKPSRDGSFGIPNLNGPGKEPARYSPSLRRMRVSISKLHPLRSAAVPCLHAAGLIIGMEHQLGQQRAFCSGVMPQKLNH